MLYLFAFSYCSWGSQSKKTEVVCHSLFQGFWCFWTVVLEKTLESPLDWKIKPVHPKGNQSWIFIGRTDAETLILVTGCKELTHWKRPWSWERLKAGGEGDDRGWDGWMAPLTRWTWVWASSESWWWTRKPGMQQSMGSQKVGHSWATELNWVNRIQVHPIKHKLI